MPWRRAAPETDDSHLAGANRLQHKAPNLNPPARLDPDDSGPAMKEIRIQGIISLARQEMFADATAIVGLDDVTMIDAPSRRIAETIIEHVSGLRDQIPFELTTRFEPSASASYALAAEIRLGPRDAPGLADYVSTIACPWAPTDVAPKTILVQRIGVDVKRR